MNRRRTSPSIDSFAKREAQAFCMCFACQNSVLLPTSCDLFGIRCRVDYAARSAVLFPRRTRASLHSASHTSVMIAGTATRPSVRYCDSSTYKGTVRTSSNSRQTDTSEAAHGFQHTEAREALARQVQHDVEREYTTLAIGSKWTSTPMRDNTWLRNRFQRSRRPGFILRIRALNEFYIKRSTGLKDSGRTEAVLVTMDIRLPNAPL